MRSVGKAIVLAVGAIVALGFGASDHAAARPAHSHLAQASNGAPVAGFMPITGRTSTPWGWVDFCARYAAECAGGPLPPEDVELTPANWRLIQQVNEKVNHAVHPMSDMDHWGVVDQWDIPSDGYGDCEDYALLKRKLLISLGLPRQALLMTVVKDEHGDGHAILTVKTDRGEFVLDNMRENVMAWDAVPYTFVKRQSQTNPDFWEQIGPPTLAPLIVSR
jgi:predicted transglutaminase-like cysteine proteinase